jgi:hypothetical protein
MDEPQDIPTATTGAPISPEKIRELFKGFKVKISGVATVKNPEPKEPDHGT